MNEEEEKMNIYELITKKIIEELEKGIIPWRKPWISDTPKNLITKKEYRGINRLLLSTISNKFNNSYFVTFKQINEIGGYVKKGEKGHIVVFWKVFNNDEIEEKEEIEKNDKRFVLRYYTVFNLEQCWIPEEKKPKNEINNNVFEIEKCENIINNMPKKPVIKYGYNQAFYNFDSDYIGMPSKEKFISMESFYSTLFHELVHSTGHETRLNRKMVGKYGNKEIYSKEELIAEIGASFLNDIAGIRNVNFNNSIAYINSWLKVLKNDKRLIVMASNQAQKAVDFILDEKE